MPENLDPASSILATSPLDVPLGNGLDVATPEGLDPTGPQLETQTTGLQLGDTPPIRPQTFGQSSGKGTALRDRIISMGMQYLGTPYVWGGTKPGGFDCSGLLQYIFGKNGIKLPRISAEQARYGARIGINALRPGDLVAWDENGRNVGADHIAIYIGNGKILEAPHTGAVVRVRTLGENEGAWGVSLNLPGDN